MTAAVEETNLIAFGARADEERRRRHGVKTTFVRVFEVHVNAIPGAMPARVTAGEFRVVGKPASAEDALAVVKAARVSAGTVRVTAFSLADLFEIGGNTTQGFTELSKRLFDAGLETIAEVPIDALPEGVVMPAVQIAVKAGLHAPRLTVREAAPDSHARLIALAVQIQDASGGVRAFAPLPRVSSIAQPSTGYDDVRAVAAARLQAHNIDSIQVDWLLYGPKLAQVALTMGADDVDGVSPLEGDLGRRRSPIEEIRGNITAAGLEPVERNGSFEPIGR